MPKPKRSPELELVDILIAKTDLAADTLSYVIRCRRQGDSWRLMGGELTAKLGRDVGFQWLLNHFRHHPDVLAAEAAYDAERASRLTPAAAE